MSRNTDFGNKVMVGVHKPMLTDELKKLISNFEPHLIFFASAIESKEQITAFIKELRSLYTNNKAIFAVDVEGGKVNRFKGKPGFEGIAELSAKEMGQAGFETIQEQGEDFGRMLAEIGIDSPLGPVMDTLVNNDSIIAKQKRGFSSDPQEVYEMAKVFSDGLAKYDIKACGKHFWGHGGVVEDSHEEAAAMNAKTFKKESLAFKLAFVDGFLPMVMASHLHCPALDSKLPCSMSKMAMGHARESGFNGVIISDDIFMKALSENYSLEEIYQHFFNATGDIMIIGKPDYAERDFQMPIEEMLEVGYRLFDSFKFSMKTWDDSQKRISKLTN